ncbi:MAG: deoxyhypusine synthase [Candidatus Micrarchaeales archaeon]|jgi:deoxyhypusine synthase|uniref:Deoxyhypusine synthase n=1 Tax=Candidatus Micrarchaeum acidiphilum ARMAN-2 TaxID=425595 RepID=C7DI33_MICA2|nr:MAG: Deoxyhypusine synthase [Candidatus Micrarchaeum acidiphilum ARMAN-2]MCW6160855.1 deoxyhypusine synthase [Candidatus Micrarchaeales archaeon]
MPRINKKELLATEVKDVKIKKDMKVSELITGMSKIGGFSAQHMVKGIKILKEMDSDSKSFNFLSFPADIISTGLRGVIAGMVKHFDAIITTGGTLDHDIARAFGGKYSLGTFNADDSELHKIGVYRLGNVFIENKEYGLKLEESFNKIMSDIYHSKDYKKEYSASELIYEFGKRIQSPDSILRQAYLHKVKVFNPGILDGAFGTQLSIFAQDHDFKLNLIKDELELSNIAFDNKVTGALMIGGGISKHHVIWWNQFKGGLDYAVYITTATQFDGSLSGARLTEAVSWGKVKEKAKYVTIDGDATIILPFMCSAINMY